MPIDHLKNGMMIAEHVQNDNDFFVYKIVLKRYGRQYKGSWESGDFIRNSTKRPLCHHTMEKLLEHSNDIPDSWRGKVICFYGSIFKMKTAQVIPGAMPARTIEYDQFYVPCIYFSQNRWVIDFLWLDDEFGPTRVSAELPPLTIWQRIKSIFI